MQSERHISPDGQLTLISAPTQTINAQNPDGINDWIIEINPGGLHTHPDMLVPAGSSDQAKKIASQAFIEDILEDRTVLIVRSVSNQIIQVSWIDSHTHSLESAIQETKSDPYRSQDPSDQTITFRRWSGIVLATITPES